MPKDTNLIKDIQKIELDPNKRYVFFIPCLVGPSEADKRMVHGIAASLNKVGISNFTVISMPHPEDIRIIETPPHE
jgi:hypothetical protein